MFVFPFCSRVNDQSWFEDAVITAIQRLDEFYDKEYITNDISNNLEVGTTECESQYSTDLFEDDENTSSKHSVESPKDLAITSASEMPSRPEKLFP